MKKISIITDMCSDLSDDIVSKENIKIIPIYYYFDKSEEVYSGNKDISVSDFYNNLRDGKVVKTIACNPEVVKSIIEEELKNDNDVICITMSSKISSTFQNINIAACDLREDYPESKIEVIDSCTASLAEGMITYKACLLRNENKNFEEIVEYLEKYKHLYSIEYYVDDLSYLVRGGRLDKASGIIGNVLNIKPLLHFSKEGNVEVVSKVRGSKTALKVLNNNILNLCDNSEPSYVIHSDNINGANDLFNTIYEKEGFTNFKINDISYIIGSHIGPGAVGVVYKKKLN